MLNEAPRYRKLSVYSQIEEDRDVEEETLFPPSRTWPTGEGENQEYLLKHRLKLSEIVLLYQYHNKNHVPSCFKEASKVAPECRYGFPRRPVVATAIDENMKLSIKRKEHNEYINTFSDVLSMLFRCSGMEWNLLIFKKAKQE